MTWARLHLEIKARLFALHYVRTCFIALPDAYTICYHLLIVLLASFVRKRK